VECPVHEDAFEGAHFVFFGAKQRLGSPSLHGFQVSDCLCWTGMGPDSRVLITKARKIAQKYMLTYGEPIPVNQLVREVASVMQVNLSIHVYFAHACSKLREYEERLLSLPKVPQAFGPLCSSSDGE